MKKLFIVLAAGVFFIVLMSYSASAQAPEGPFTDRPGIAGRMDHSIWKDLQELKIDKDRMEAIRETESRMIKDAIRKKAELQIASMELREILEKDPVNMQMVEAKLKQIESLKTEMHLARIKAIEDVKAKLTPGERKKLREIVEASFMKHRMYFDDVRCPQPPGPPVSWKRGDEKKTPPAKQRAR